MASQPSGYNEERNLLRLRAWEQRVQETSQTKELNPENVPLFGEPYKTNKGDELSTRIQRMLGSYEDVNNSCSFSTEASPIPTYASFLQSAQSQPNPDKSTKTPFHNQDIYTSSQTQKGMPSNICSSLLGRESTAASPPKHVHSSTFSKTPLNTSQFSHSGQQQKESEAFSDLRGCVSLHQETSAQSPDAKPLPPPHSSSHNIDMDTRDALNRHQHQGSTDYSSESTSIMDVSMLNIKHSPKDAALPQAKTNMLLPSQSFPSLLSSKQGGIVMTQKPTAYVRPMDGQDQVVNESPELKPSPEHYAPLPDLISKSDLVKTKIMPQFMETATEKPQCVEDILREMTHSWPPLLTTLHSPISDQPSKSPFQAKEAEQVSSCPEQKNVAFAPAEQSHFNQQSSSVSFEAAHSRGTEMTSSSDSESSRGSESDSESSAEEPPRLPAVSLVKTQPDAPSVSDWQLGNWIRSSQQNSSTDGQEGALVSQSPAHKQLLPTHNSKQTSRDVSKEFKLSKPQPSSYQKEFTDDPSVPQRCSETPQNNYFCQQSCKKSLSADVSSCSDSRKLLKLAKMGCLGRSEAALGVKCEDAATIQARKPSFPDRPKVKMKTCQRKEDSRNKTDVKRTKRTKGKKQKAGSEVTLVLYSRCPSCGVNYPNPCSCPSRSPAQPSPAPPARFSCSKTRTDTLCQSSTKVSHKLTHKSLETSGPAAKSSRDHFQPPRSLMVKIDLSLLTMVPQTSSVQKGIPSSVKRPTLVTEQDEGSSDVFKTHKCTKISKKTKIVEDEAKSLPKKKRKLENKNTSSAHASVKVENSSCPEEVREQKKAKKPFQDPATSKDRSKNPNHRSRKTQESNKEAVKCKDSHKNRGKDLQRTRQEKQKLPKSSLPVPPASRLHREALTSRPLLTFDERQYPVKHYIKEAKKLKHKADAESDKLTKAFNYLDAAMFFVESGIAMEKDPQISVSSYTMFAETVELLKFVLKLKNPADSSAPSSEKDFLALCLKCQSVLQMAMYRHKHKTAVTFSKTLTDHFNNSAQASHNPLSSSKMIENPPTNMSSPASTSSSTSVSGPFSNMVSIPQEIEQVTFSYVSITTLFLSAYDIWEQAEELAHRGSGLLAELDAVMGPLSLTSTMTSLVRYTRQGVHWLRLESQKV